MYMNKPLIGAHVSIAGGIEKSFDRACEIGASCFQIFTRTNRSWTAQLYSSDEIARFKQAQRNSTISSVIGHASYLINLASATEETREKSKNFLVSELIRCSSVGIRTLVLHPGSHGGEGEDLGIERLVEGLQFVLSQTPDDCVIALETMAGQGSSLGSSLEGLKKIVQAMPSLARIKFCIDTCHIFAAGYDLSSGEKFELFLNEFDQQLGLKNVSAIHCNDSLTVSGSRVDRHANLAQGKMNPEVFSVLMNNSVLAAVPKILETPEKDGQDQYAQEIVWLTSLVKNTQ
ncbi:deoxyribonuclease IV [Candidatus Dependentiae bacterium]|nr:deoxyribonuclease IV [Candidatus Dependentiae bacterium]